MKKALIKTNNLCKSYIVGKEGSNIIKNLSFEIYEGDFTVVMGASGSGKSTLLYSISTMDRPTSGEVYFEERDVAKMGEREVSELRKKELAFIFQSINLLPDLTAFENVAYYGYGAAEKTAVNRRAEQLLENFGLLEQRDKYPGEMSGGQCQRCAIARAIVVNPKVIFADEPTGALNSKMGEEVLDELSRINENGQSIVMVTHDIRSAARGNRLLYLADGRITGDIPLGSYDKSRQKEREETIFNFLSRHNW